MVFSSTSGSASYSSPNSNAIYNSKQYEADIKKVRERTSKIDEAEIEAKRKLDERSQFPCMKDVYNKLRQHENEKLRDSWRTVHYLERECMHITNATKRNQIIKDFCNTIMPYLSHHPVDVKPVLQTIADTIDEMHQQPHRGRWGISVVWRGLQPSISIDGDAEFLNFNTSGSRRNARSSYLGPYIKFNYGAHNPVKYPCVEYLYSRTAERFNMEDQQIIMSRIEKYVTLLDDQAKIIRFCDDIPWGYIKSLKDAIYHIDTSYKNVRGVETVENFDPPENIAAQSIGASPDSRQYRKDGFAFKGMTRAIKLRQCRNMSHTEKLNDPECLGYLRHYDKKSLLHAMWHGGKRRKTRRR